MIVASCGHQVEHISHLWDRSVADHDRQGNRAVSYMSLCKQCYDQYEKDGMILHDEGEENKWLGMSAPSQSAHQCSVCQCEFTDDEGGIQGYFGVLPVSFCPTCYSCMIDMVYHDHDPGDKE